MTVEEDYRTGKYQVRGAVSIRDGTALQNLHQGTSYDLMPSEMALSLTGFPALLTGVQYSSKTVNSFLALSAIQGTSGAIGIPVFPMASPSSSLTASAPTAASVGIASGAVVSANTSRKGLVLVNTSGATISLAFDQPAVLNSGITLAPNGTYEMDPYMFTTGEVRAIASSAASNLTIQEFV